MSNQPKIMPFDWPFLHRLHGRFPRLTRVSVFGVYGAVIGTIFILILMYSLSLRLPTLESLERPNYDLPTQVYDHQDRLITEFYVKRRVLIPYSDVPETMIQALLAIEDSRFWIHFGVDPVRMLKALIVDVIKMDFAQGASTLTQQTAKMFLLSRDKKIVRKLKEILLAVRIESRFTKEQILELYLNKTYFGHGAYGLEAAAQGYFSKSARDLTLEECALLAGLPQAPSRWAPTVNMEAATRRRNLVLRKMNDEGFISDERLEQALKNPIVLRINKNEDNNETSYYTEHIRRFIFNRFGGDTLYKGGLKVKTYMDLDQQIYAQNALSKGLEEHDRRQGYRGAKRNLWREVAKEKGTVNELGEPVPLPIFVPADGEREVLSLRKFEEPKKEALKQALTQKAAEVLQDNAMILESHVVGVVGEVSREEVEIDLGRKKGRLFIDDHAWARPADYAERLTWKNRLRDFKKILSRGDVVEVVLKDFDSVKGEFRLELSQTPEANGGIFVMDPRSGEVRAMSGGYDFQESEYNRAIQAKRQPGSAFKPIVFSLALDNSFTRATMLDDTPLVFKDTEWRPGNFSKKFKGKISLKEALAHSKNVPTVRLTMSLGIDKIIEHANRLGLNSQLPDDLTIGLGTASVTLKDLARTYAIFANGGSQIEPRFIESIEDRFGNKLTKDKDGKPLFTEEELAIKEVFSKQSAFLMSATLQDVVKIGSGWRAKDINRPAAGKTGTTNNYTDAWFMGYVPQLLAGVYIGFDDTQKSLGNLETGSRAAAPVWVSFMKNATKTMTILPFEVPEGIEIVRIMPESGLLDCSGSPGALFEYFKAGTAPQHCHQDTVGYQTEAPQKTGESELSEDAEPGSLPPTTSDADEL